MVPAPIREFSSICVPGKIILPAPIAEKLSTVDPTKSFDGGLGSLVNKTRGKIQT